jgi:hypothetical protein
MQKSPSSGTDPDLFYCTARSPGRSALPWDSRRAPSSATRTSPRSPTLSRRLNRVLVWSLLLLLSCFLAKEEPPPFSSSSSVIGRLTRSLLDADLGFVSSGCYVRRFGRAHRRLLDYRVRYIGNLLEAPHRSTVSSHIARLLGAQARLSLKVSSCAESSSTLTSASHFSVSGWEHGLPSSTRLVSVSLTFASPLLGDRFAHLERSLQTSE